MPETTEAVAEETETETQTQAEETVDFKSEAEKWKALARQNEQRAKQNAEAAKRLAEIEDANKSEVERAIARAEEAERRAQQLELDSVRASVALEKGLTPSQAKRLVGASREELEADADDLLADLKANRASTVASADGQGRTGTAVGATGGQLTRADLQNMTKKQIDEARRDGRLDDLLKGS